MVGITPGEELETTVGEGNKDKKDTTQFLLTATFRQGSFWVAT